MPLRIELAPEELVFIGNTLIKGGRRRTEFLVMTDAKVLRGRNLITEDQAGTACRRLYVTLEKAYLADNPSEHDARFFEQAKEIIEAVPTTAPYIANVYALMLKGEHYKALMACKDLLSYEEHLRVLLEGGIAGRQDAGAVSAPTNKHPSPEWQ